MVKAGITGGIGSGKTIISKIFEKLDIPIYRADERAKALMDTDPNLKEAIQKQFGKAVLKGGKIDKKYLAEIVFNNPEKLNILNSIVHPAVEKDFLEWLRQQKAPYIIKEAAILIETGMHEKLDYVIVVTAPKELRMERVMERDAVTREDVKKRMARQMSDAEREKFADTVLINDDKHLVVPQVLAIHNHLLRSTEKVSIR